MESIFVLWQVFFPKDLQGGWHSTKITVQLMVSLRISDFQGGQWQNFSQNALLDLPISSQASTLFNPWTLAAVNFICYAFIAKIK